MRPGTAKFEAVMGTTSGSVRFVKPLRGFVKLPREVMALPFWDGFRDRARVQGLFVHVVLNAMHRPGAVVAGVTLCCGEWRTTNARLAKETGIPLRTVRRWLEKLIHAGVLVDRSMADGMARVVDRGRESNGRVLSVCDWPRYNSPPCLFGKVGGQGGALVHGQGSGQQNGEVREEILKPRAGAGAGARGDGEVAREVLKVLEGTDGWHARSSGVVALRELELLVGERGGERMLAEARWFREHEGERFVVSIRGAEDLKKWGGIRRQMERGEEERAELPVVVDAMGGVG